MSESAPYTVHLARHEDVPEQDRPTFTFRVPRLRKVRRLMRLIGRLQAVTPNTDPAEADELFSDIQREVEESLIGWDNQVDERGEPLPFDPAQLDRIIDEAAMFELIMRLRVGRPTPATPEKD